ncbi:hypothetical protein ANN_22407 [Periplaneta americana]|uniref:Uncharacterized protein n=1 Tax=Periplaneta americana TaxID=6978 RepID=A0ABQ8S827_PERAM|nr:hypothetical protein ANN_22407 [Periplaneta americana]
MSPGSSTESYPAFARIGLRKNLGKNLNYVTCPDRNSNPGHLVSRPDALTVTPQLLTDRLTRPEALTLFVNSLRDLLMTLLSFNINHFMPNIYIFSIEFPISRCDFENGQRFELTVLTEIVNILHVNTELDFENGDALYQEYCLLKEVMPILKDLPTSQEHWDTVLKTCSVPNLKIAEHIHALPISNAHVERVFKRMKNLWTDKRNWMRPELVKSELLIRQRICYELSDIRLTVRKNLGETQQSNLPKRESNRRSIAVRIIRLYQRRRCAGILSRRVLLSLGFSEPTHATCEVRGPPRTNLDYMRDSEWFLWLRSAQSAEVRREVSQRRLGPNRAAGLVRGAHCETSANGFGSRGRNNGGW